MWPDWTNFRHFGYFSLIQFLPKQAESTHSLFEGFKSSLMWMFWALKFKIWRYFDIFGHFFKNWTKFYSVLWSHCFEALVHFGFFCTSCSINNFFPWVKPNTGTTTKQQEKYCTYLMAILIFVHRVESMKPFENKKWVTICTFYCSFLWNPIE